MAKSQYLEAAEKLEKMILEYPELYAVLKNGANTLREKYQKRHKTYLKTKESKNDNNKEEI